MNLVSSRATSVFALSALASLTSPKLPCSEGPEFSRLIVPAATSFVLEQDYEPFKPITISAGLRVGQSLTIGAESSSVSELFVDEISSSPLQTTEERLSTSWLLKKRKTGEEDGNKEGARTTLALSEVGFQAKSIDYAGKSTDATQPFLKFMEQLLEVETIVAYKDGVRALDSAAYAARADKISEGLEGEELIIAKLVARGLHPDSSAFFLLIEDAILKGAEDPTVKPKASWSTVSHWCHVNVEHKPECTTEIHVVPTEIDENKEGVPYEVEVSFITKVVPGGNLISASCTGKAFFDVQRRALVRATGEFLAEYTMSGGEQTIRVVEKNTLRFGVVD